MGKLDALHDKYRSALAEVGKQTQDRYSVAYVDSLDLGTTIENYGVKTLPAVVVQKTAGATQKYVYTGKLSSQTILGFVGLVEAGKVKAKAKSEPPPKERDNKAAVRQVVGRTLHEEVLTTDKDV